jgi:hypothetical protein
MAARGPQILLFFLAFARLRTRGAFIAGTAACRLDRRGSQPGLHAAAWKWDAAGAVRRDGWWGEAARDERRAWRPSAGRDEWGRDKSAGRERARWAALGMPGRGGAGCAGMAGRGGPSLATRSGRGGTTGRAAGCPARSSRELGEAVVTPSRHAQLGGGPMSPARPDERFGPWSAESPRGAIPDPGMAPGSGDSEPSPLGCALLCGNGWRGPERI